MRRKFHLLFVPACLALLLAGMIRVPAQAEELSAEEVQDLNDEITARQARLDELEDRMEEYREIIRQKQAEARSLNSDLAIIDNEIAGLELDVEATELEIENTEAQVQVLAVQIQTQTAAMDRQKKLLADVLRQMQQADNIGLIEIVFGHNNFTDLFDELSQLEEVHNELDEVLGETQTIKNNLQDKRSNLESKLAQLDTLAEDLSNKQEQLEGSVVSKEIILAATKSSESQYQQLVRELKQEQSYIDSQLTLLQRELDQKLMDSDDYVGGVPIINWPVSNFRITTLFHDPTYPFRNLFEHSGLDLAVPTGTAVKAAAPGYVAFVKTGRMYGNYVMVVHGSGFATLYAHLSQANVQPDQFVGRGETIGLSGNTGFSTGPHLHFEVRLDGIPVDPMGYILQ